MAYSQDDSTKHYTRFRDDIVLYSDIGYNSAPFRLVYSFDDDVNKLKYRHNFSPVLGFGVSYKWFALRIGFALKGTTRSESRFGQSTYLDIGTQFQIKKWFFELDARSFKGYAIKNATKWNDTLTAFLPNDIRKNTQTFNISINSWYFFNENVNMQAIQGKTGHYEKEVRSFYLKPTFSVHGVGNEESSVVPTELIDSLFDKTRSKLYSSIDIGLVPGYTYVNRINNWQFCAFFGLGAVAQAKFYSTVGGERGFLGLSPRYDVRLYGGFSVPRYFAFLSLNLDNKSIRFTDFKYRQNYFNFRITGGIRLDRGKK
ncbi:MAG: DUF4421 family protein [Crocinitomicaceae bacterium]|nr:DUF4421 family protein [Crocinitomicaceae bacterium]